MYSGRARLLGDALDVGVDLLAALSDEVRRLVDDDYDVRHGLRHVARRGVAAPEHVWLREGGAVVEVVDVPHPRARKELEALLHLGYRPVEREDDFAVVGDYGDEKVRDGGVGGELDALGVDHDELQLLRGARHEEAADERVEAHRLALSGRAGDEHVRHRREVRDELLAVRALSEEERKLRLRVAPGVRLEYLAERYPGGLAVRHLDADLVLARDRRLDSQGLRLERHHQRRLEGGELLRTRPRLGREGVFCDDRTLHGVRERRVDVEELQRVHELLRHLPDVAVVRHRRLERIEQRKGREDVRSLVLGRRLLLSGLRRRRRRLGGGRGLLDLRTQGCCGALGLFRAQALLLGLLFRAEAFLLSLLLCADALLLGLGLLLLEPRLLLGGLAGLHRGLVCCQLALVLLFRACGFRVGRDVSAHRRPAVEGREERRDVREAYPGDERDEHDDHHQDGRAEVADEGREEAGHDEVPDRAARVRDVDVRDGGGDSGRVFLRDLEEACARREHDEEPHRAAEVEYAPPRDEEERHDDADDGNDPHREADELVAGVRERVAERADPVRRGVRRDLERRHGAPVVGEKGHEGE